MTKRMAPSMDFGNCVLDIEGFTSNVADVCVLFFQQDIFFTFAATVGVSVYKQCSLEMVSRKVLSFLSLSHPETTVSAMF